MKASLPHCKSSVVSNFYGVLLVLVTVFTAVTPARSAPKKAIVVVDDFESGVGAWTRNDKIKNDNPASDVVLVDLISTRPNAGGLPGSSGAGLFTFKDAKNSWASASIRVNGAAWAKAGAQNLTFWLDADGASEGTTIVLRGRNQTSGGAPDELFQIPIRLNIRSWRRVTVPLKDIRNESGPLLSRLKNIYLLQFVQRGAWNSRFFSVDQLQIEGNGIPLGTPTAVTQSSSPPPPTPTSAPADPNAVQVGVDFLRKQGRIRTSANISVGAGVPSALGAIRYPLQENEDFRKALTTLHPRFVRLDAAPLIEMIDSLRPAFDYTKLTAAVRQVRIAGSEPLIAMTNEPTWGLDERAYGAFCAGAARAINGQLSKPVRYFELPTGATTSDDASAVTFYNSGRAALKALSPLFRVGGIGASSGRTGTLMTLISRAQGLDFLSLQFYGSMSGAPPEATLFWNAQELSALRLAAAALDKSRWKRAPIYLTQSNLNKAPNADTPQLPADDRTVEMVSAAWWTAFLGNSSRLADQVFHNDAVNPEWGLLNEKAEAYPAYYALWMWNTFFPSGSERVQTTTNQSSIAAFAANTPTAHNLLLANTTANDVSVRVSIRGFAVLRAARQRILEDPHAERLLNFEELPKSPFQNLILKPYAVALLQFTEPPKARVSISTR